MKKIISEFLKSYWRNLTTPRFEDIDVNNSEDNVFKDQSLDDIKHFLDLADDSEEPEEPE